MQDDAEPPRVAAERPIGVFDSGVGGLSVLLAVRAELPDEDILYVADSGYSPYGDRPASLVVERAVTITEFLAEQGAKAMVVACNTATAISVDTLRSRFAVPIVAIEPAVKPASLRTRSRVIGVLATAGTSASGRMEQLLDRYGRSREGDSIEVIIQPCPGLADLVERGDIESDAARALVAGYVRPIVERGADILVLGCTHYPFLRLLIQDIAGPDVEIIDPAIPVARELRRRLTTAHLLRTGPGPASYRFWTTGEVDEVAPIVGKLWGTAVDLQHLAR